MLDALIRGPGAALPGVLLLADPAGGGLPAARQAAVRVARAWARTGRRTILADLEFGSPGLHALLGVPNDEGVADHFAFGTSFQGLARPVDDGAWSLVPAGAWVEDPGAILRSPGWGRLLRELADQDATVLGFVAANAAGVPHVAEAFGAVIALGELRDVPGIRGFSVMACLTLPASPPASPDRAPQPLAERESADAAFERIRLPTDARTREALIADLRYRQRAARMAPASDYQRPSLADVDAGAGARPVAAAVVAGVLSPEAAAAPAEQVVAWGAGAGNAETATVRVGEPPPPERTTRVLRQRSYTPLWWTLAVVALLSLLAGSWYFVRERLQARRAAETGIGEVLEASPQSPQRATEVVPRAADTILAYAVSVGEHVRLPSAEQRAGALQSALPTTRFFISPVVREEALYYDVLAGPVGDSALAATLFDTLSARGGGQRVTEVRLAPYAFLLGDYATRDSAQARIASLRRLEIPSYTLELAGPPPRFRVYAGSYTGPVDAEVMKQILQSVGEPDVLVPRVGRR